MDISSQQNFFPKIKNENKAAIKVSFLLVYLSVKQGKPFTDGELIKSCLTAAAEEMCPGRKNLFKTTSHLM